MPVRARVAVSRFDDPELRVEEVSLPDPGPDQVVVKEYFSGICHSQLHQIHGTGGPRDRHLVMGHEATGVVVAKGANVTHVKEGDTVWVTFINRNEAFKGMPVESIWVDLPGGDRAMTWDVFKKLLACWPLPDPFVRDVA